MANINQLKDINGNQFYPQSHTKAVIDSNGTTVDTLLANANDAISNESSRAAQAESTLQNNINAETSRAQAAESNLQQLYQSLTQSDIEVVNSVPASGVANKIYRVVGTNSYSDYMFNAADLNTPVKMAEYNNAIDDEPTAGSDNLVKSGGVYNELVLGAVYDVSAKNPTAGPNNDGKWESLYALLSDTNLSTLIPTTVRKGGMSIKFVQSSDNKYVQFRLTSDSFNTTVANWQGVDDKPIVDSDNLIKSGGVELIFDYIHALPKNDHLIRTDYNKSIMFLDCRTMNVGKKYIIYYKNGYSYKIGIGTGLNGVSKQSSLGDALSGASGKIEFTCTAEANQIRTYAYGLSGTGLFECYVCSKDEEIILYSELKKVIDDIAELNGIIGLTNQIVGIENEVDGYYWKSSVIESDGKRRPPIDLNGNIGKNIEISISNIDTNSVRRIGFTNDISDLTNIVWTSYVMESNFKSAKGKSLLITGRYLLISYRRSSNVNCSVSDNIATIEKENQNFTVTNYHYPSTSVVFETFSSSTLYKSYNFEKDKRYIIHYINKSGSQVQFGTGHEYESVQGGYKTLPNNTSGTFVFMPLLAASQIRLYVESLSSVTENVVFYIEDAKTKLPLDDVDKSPTFISCFKKITCVGDSLTQGSFNRNDGGAEYATIKEYSYPKFLQRHTGVETINLGISGDGAGRTEDSWYDDAVQAGYMTANNMGDIAIIALGTNDISRYGSFTGDVSTDIDLNNRENNATTSVGGYANIIQAIRELSPRTIIFCVTISNERNTDETRTAANTKIKAIAALFDNCHVIDMQTYAEPTFAEQNYFSLHYKNGSHNNALGYEIRSRQLISYIDWIIENNPDDFCNLQFFGTNYYYNK